MTITIETINEKKYTVIKKPFDPEWVWERIKIGVPVAVSTKSPDLPPINFVWHIDRKGNCKLGRHYAANIFGTVGCVVDDYCSADYIDSVITILPALPRNPKPEDAPLLYRYMAEGLNLAGNYFNYEKARDVYIEGRLQESHIFISKIYGGFSTTITHALYNNERVEIALED